jgi:ABC-type Fe3+-hydroxamate transport system substrate-binding protein
MSIWTIIGIAIAFYVGMLAASIFANRRILEAEEQAEAWAIKYAALVETVATRTDQAPVTKKGTIVTENDTREGA